MTFIRAWIEKWFIPKNQLINDIATTHLLEASTKQIKEDFVEAVAENKPIEEKPLKVKRAPTIKVSKKKPEVTE